ncbi:AAA family ATPase [Pseudescherichia vulneris]|uniref:AAA family ATPase n=1 Tax=Pseudescherichia vulneris TaxID=566 RepID=UPI00301B1D97
MKASIKSINYTKNKISNSVNLNGKNLIIAGNNGAGKTQFLSKAHNYIQNIVNSDQFKTMEELESQREELTKSYNEHINDGSLKTHFSIQLGGVNNFIAASSDFNISFSGLDKLRAHPLQTNFILKMFPAIREAKIANDGKINSLETLTNEYRQTLQYNNSADAGIFFERYLVTVWNYGFLKKAIEDTNEFVDILNIITSIQNDLRELFEDDSLVMTFNIEELKIFIEQKDKEKFGLDQLSSGFSSLLSIYTELLIRCHLSQVEKSEMTGIVLIDEIDAHLHVTLQKKILPFFTRSFPQIQFIVTTHSPFVIQSVSDAVILNLTTTEQMEDLSLYSYTSIIKGLLGEDVASDKLSSYVEELLKLNAANNFNERFNEIVNLLDENILSLDNKSKAALFSAKNNLMDFKEE